MDTVIEHAQDDEQSHLNPSTSSESDERKPLPNKLKYLTAAAIFYGNITLGCGFNSYGPAATSMQNKYETDDDGISKVFTILTGSYMVGALSASLVFRFINRQLATIIAISTMAAMMYLTPHCPTITLFFISAAVGGYCVGCYDTAQFVWIMEMMQKDCPPFVQCQHFFYALGANLGPLMMAPFLDEVNDGGRTTTTLSSYTIEEDGYSLPFPKENILIEPISKKSETGDSKLFIPYTIFAVLMAITSVVQILLFIFMRYYPPPPEIMDEEQIEKAKENERTSERENQGSGFKIGSWSLPKLRMVVLSAAFYGAYCGMEMCTFQFFPKFGQNSDLALSESESTYVLTGMTASYAVGRAIGIIAVFRISTQLILCGNIVLVIVAIVLLIGWATSSLPVLWTASILFGIGFSSMYPAFSAYIERYLVFTNLMGSIMIVAGAGVAAVYPLIIGKFIYKNVVVLGYTNVFSITLIVIAFGMLSFLTYRNKTRY